MTRRALNNDLVEIAGQVKAETERAYRFSTDGKNSVWLPKSQCEWEPETNRTYYGTMSMPEWLAMEKGLI